MSEVRMKSELELYEELNRLNNTLDFKIKEYKEDGLALALAERDYKIKLRTEALKLRAEGEAITLINQIVYGIPEVAELRLARDQKQVIYDATRESINTIKLQIRILDNQIQREWGQSK